MLYSVVLFSQDLPEVLPPSPEAASLIKYSQTDISPYTGLPNISIPFHTISYKGVNIPIGLSYSGGGNKVSDIASWVGLGWNLQAGGLVTRTINWLPDDKKTFGYMNTTYTLQDFSQRPDGAFTQGALLETQDYQLLDATQEIRDYEADEFNYTIPGYSGTFYYDQNVNDFVEFPRSNVKISAIKTSLGKITGFTITTPNGVVYNFGGTDNYLEKIKGVKSYTQTLTGSFTSNNVGSYGDTSDPYYQSWMLKSISFPTSNNQITFNYVLEDDVKAMVISGEDVILPAGIDPYKHSINYVEKKFTQPKISEIQFPSGKVVFSKSSTERLDLKNSYALDKITLYDTNNNFVKSFQLNTVQSAAVLMANYQAPFFDVHDTEGKSRLRLNSISEISESQNTNGVYSFEYNAQKLPGRYSNAVDYFGYFNGQINANKIPRSRGYTPSYPYAIYGDANRAIHPNYTQAEILTKLTLPTGGVEEFIWENHKISSFNDGSSHLYKDYTLKETIGFQNTSLFLDTGYPVTAYSKTFTVASNSDGWVDLNIDMFGCSGPDINNTNCSYIISLEGVDVSFTQTISLSDFAIQLTPGKTYKIVAKSRSNQSYCDPITDPTCTNPSPILNVVANYQIDPTPGEYLFGGLRIGAIKVYTDALATVPVSSRQFDYTFDASAPNPNLTSGMVYQLPINNSIVNANNTTANGVAKTVKISANGAIKPVKQGALVGYRNVKESYTNQGLSNGYKEYKYQELDLWTDYVFDDVYFSSPFSSVHKRTYIPDWRNGNLLETKYFDGEDVLLKHDSFTYERFDTFHRRGSEFAVQVYRMPYVGVGENIFDNRYITYYGYTTEYHRLKQQKSISHLGNTQVTSITDYTYNNNPLLYSEMRVANSKGEVLKTEIQYAKDVNNQRLINEHRIAEPIKNKTFNGTIKLNEQETVYKDYNGLYLPEKVQVSKGTGVLEDRVVYHSYDDKGNPLEVSKKDGTHIVYIWGYQKTQPIAKIENAKLSDIPSATITSIQTASNLDTNAATENTLRTALNGLRGISSLSKAQITTFTYDPLVGVTSITDPRGQTMYYEYDEFNRLSFVKDNEGKLLKETQYKYKN